ncbi:MAG: SGNH/GDSL hydrolase family protein [Nakamurella sp.]
MSRSAAPSLAPLVDVEIVPVPVPVPVRDGDPGSQAPGPCALAAAPSRPRIVALGDSVTVGVGDVDERGWAVHLAHVLGGTLVNLAANGARAHTVVTEQLDAALASQPAVATLMIGGNDVLRGDFDARDVGSAVEQSLLRLLATGCTVVLVLPPPVGRALPAPAIVRRVLARRMDLVRAVTLAVVQRISPAAELLVLDSTRVQEVGGDRVLHIDRIHPSPLGHRLLADQVATLLGERGFDTQAVMSPVPNPLPRRERLWWLIVRGTPWLIRRSRDLLPQLVITVLREERRRRVEQRDARRVVG